MSSLVSLWASPIYHRNAKTYINLVQSMNMHLIHIPHTSKYQSQVCLSCILIYGVGNSWIGVLGHLSIHCYLNNSLVCRFSKWYWNKTDEVTLRTNLLLFFSLWDIHVSFLLVFVWRSLLLTKTYKEMTLLKKDVFFQEWDVFFLRCYQVFIKNYSKLMHHPAGSPLWFIYYLKHKQTLLQMSWKEQWMS